MAEAIIKNPMRAGDVISIGLNKKKDEIVIKILSKGDDATVIEDSSADE